MSATWQTNARPWRVFVLAVLAVIATTVSMAGASELMREASGHRYADDMLRTKFASMHVAVLPG